MPWKATLELVGTTLLSSPAYDATISLSHRPQLLFRSSSLAPRDYYRQGPRGLTMRTWIGPHYVSQFGDERLRTTPVDVAATRWGGYRLDLVPEPWDADLPTLLAAWRRGMAHLAVAGVLALPVVRAGRVRDWTCGPGCAVGGTAAAVPD